MSIKTSYTDLQKLFQHNISVKDLAESLISFDEDKSGIEVKKIMIQKGYDVVVRLMVIQNILK